MKNFTAVFVLAIALLFALGQTVSADDSGYHPQGNSCDAGHGAFGAFSHHFADYGGVNWISADARSDGGMGHETGPAESGASATCNAH